VTRAAPPTTGSRASAATRRRDEDDRDSDTRGLRISNLNGEGTAG
jgi:hypothetical protein